VFYNAGVKRSVKR